MKHVLIIGASSAIANACAKRFALKEDKLFLVARNQEKLDIQKQDLETRGAAQVETLALDITKIDQHAKLIEHAKSTMGRLDTVLIAHGTLPNQNECQLSVEQTLQEIQVNATSTIALLTLIANDFEQQGRGDIAVITSVAGDRGRQSNYIYGAAKGMVSRFLQGLDNRLSKSGIKVLDIKPGFVDTPMTASFDKSGALWAQPEQIAEIIDNALGKRSGVIYAPWFWWGIMTIIKSIPTFIFRKLSL